MASGGPAADQRLRIGRAVACLRALDECAATPILLDAADAHGGPPNA